MSTDRQVRKLKEQASRLVAKGKYGEALAAYQKAVQVDPRDLSSRQKLAETYSRLGKKAEAIREYQTVAGSYAADGLLLKAIAICKVILALDPSHRETQSALADLYAQKRGDFQAPVTLPKSMSGAITAKPGRRSASEIRGVPAAAISTAGAAPAERFIELDVTDTGELEIERGVGASTIDVDESDVIDVDDGALEVISVEAVGGDTPTVLGTPLATNLGDLMQLGSSPPPLPPVEGGAFEEAHDLDIEVADPDDDIPAVVGSALPAVTGELLPEDEALIVEDASDDDDLLEVSEPAQVAAEDLPPIPLFSDLPRDAFIALTERMALVQAEPGEILIAEGEYAASMYIVIQGKVKVVREVEGGAELKLAELSDGAFFGEMALLSDAPRTASVIAIEDTMLFEISRELMNEITAEHPQVEQVMKRFHRNRLLTNLLRTSPIFAPFSPADKKELIEKFKSRHVEPGRLLITKDKPGDGLYVLLSGRCQVLGAKDGDDREVVLAELKEGDVFGEMSLLFRQFATASVRTSSPCIVLRLPKASFDELIMTHPQVLETLARLSEERMAANREILDSDEETLQDFLA